jgi:ATP-dependent Clp protease adapter protein ClpS
MSDVQADTGYREIIFHDDEETPLQFVIELLHSVFKKQLADGLRFTQAIRQEGKASCGTYPREITGELLEAAASMNPVIRSGSRAGRPSQTINCLIPVAGFAAICSARTSFH